MKKRIDDERNRVVNDKDLQKIWNEIEKKLNSNAELREFLQYLKQEGNEIIREKLSNQSLFKKEPWLAYLSKHKESFLGLLKVYRDNEEKLKEISSRIQKEARDWENAVDKFNDRFCTLPFRLNIENKEDVLLQNEIPSVKFSFDNQLITEKEILKVLSQGEKRALYLLNIIFEVEARKKLQQKTIFIIDDIADSFDYQNKYAIVEYLHDISCENKFYQIILTHNYDFYRTVRSRLLDSGYNANQCSQLQAIKYEDRIELICDKYQNDPFDEWKQNLDNKQYLIVCIPFLRNLTEYQNGFANNRYYNELTALLHIKDDTNSITNQKLKDIFKGIIQDKSVNPDKITDLANIVKNDILDVAKNIVDNYNSSLELETKICLSIAIRLVAEGFMIKEINNPTELAKIAGKQTKKCSDYTKNYQIRI